MSAPKGWSPYRDISVTKNRDLGRCDLCGDAGVPFYTITYVLVDGRGQVYLGKMTTQRCDECLLPEQRTKVRPET